jgi:nitrite reductase/ring-hydroxylating ferredoxin subunit
LFHQFFHHISQMKKYILLFLVVSLFFSCSNNDFNNSNPYIPNYTVALTINLNLPAYSNLRYVSNSVYYAGQGAKGIIIFNTSGTTFNAFDAACPNQALSSCSTMTINGINAVCACDNASYNLFTGLAAGKQYPMKQYRVEVSGNLLRVYN